MNVADKIAEWFHEKGIETVFGIIGGGDVEIFNAIARLKKTHIVCCHHEQAAVMSACGYFRVSGRISAALVTTGAGSSNAITGVVSAYMDSTPVLVISGNEASKYMYAPRRVWGVQGYDSSMVASHFVKYADRMRIGESISPINDLEKAYIAALHPRMGPCWIDVPKDVAAHELV